MCLMTMCLGNTTLQSRYILAKGLVIGRVKRIAEQSSLYGFKTHRLSKTTIYTHKQCERRLVR